MRAREVLLLLVSGVAVTVLACGQTSSDELEVGGPQGSGDAAAVGSGAAPAPLADREVGPDDQEREPEAADPELAEAAPPAEENAGSGSACGPESVDPRSAEAAWATLVADMTPPMKKPERVRGIYLNAWAGGSAKRRAALMQLADETEVNAFVIDVKDNTGHISYRSAVATVREIGAHCDLRIANMRDALAEMRSRGIYPIARIVVFQDPLLAAARPDLAIQHKDGSEWRDHHGQLWVDPYNRDVWDYNIRLAREAVALGFSEIQWDYVRFPDIPRSYMQTATYPAQEGRSRTEAIAEFMRYSREELADLGVQVTADVFGLTVSAGDDMGIGQKWENMVDAVDVLLPMVYPSHFAKGSYGFDHPNARPYDIVKRAMEYAVERSQGVPGAAAIRPYLQDFTLGSPAYGAKEVRAQILGARDAGVHEWILWNASSKYTAAALTSEADRLLEEVPEPKIEVVPLGRPVPRGPDGPR